MPGQRKFGASLFHRIPAWLLFVLIALASALAGYFAMSPAP